MEKYVGSVVWDKQVHDVYTEEPSLSVEHSEYHLTEYKSGWRKPKIDFRGGGEGWEMKAGNVTLGKTEYVDAVYHPESNEILEKLGMEPEDLCLMYEEKGGIIGFTFVPGSHLFNSRKAFIRKPFEYKGEVFCGLEVKGCSHNGGPVKLNKVMGRGMGLSNTDSGPMGGMYFDEGHYSLSNGIHLEKTNPLELACFELPIKYKSRFYGTKPLGIEDRIVKSSLRSSEVIGILPDFVKSLGITTEEYLETFRKNLVTDLNNCLTAGLYHCHLHGLNVDATGNITDLGDMERIGEDRDIADNFYSMMNVLIKIEDAVHEENGYKPVLELVKETVEDKKIKKIGESIVKLFH